MNEKQENFEEKFIDLTARVVSLYTRNTLCQYGLEESKALEIVSNLTGITKEKLQQLKDERYNKISEDFERSQETIINTIVR